MKALNRLCGCIGWPRTPLSPITKVTISSRKHAYIMMTPLKPHFYIVKLGFTGVYIIFIFLLKNIDCGYSLEPPRRGCSNEYLQSMFWAEIWNIANFLIWKFSVFGGEIFCIYLNRRVFVMSRLRLIPGPSHAKTCFFGKRGQRRPR